MNRNYSKILSAFILVFLGVALAAAQDAKPKTFSADSVLTSAKNEKLATGRFYFAPPRIRSDFYDVQNKVSTVFIFDYDKNAGFAIMPQFHTYSELSIDPKSQTPDGRVAGPDFVSVDPCAGHPEWKCKKTGIDTLEGRKCDVWDVMANDSDHDTVWIDQKLKFAIKYKRADGMSLEYTSIQEGRQLAPSLFQVPPGYRKLESKAESKPQTKK